MSSTSKERIDDDWSRWYGLLGGFALVSIRTASALWNPIADCDETYNYWEPLHYLMYGFGMQTWEYSPVYTLRSYAYLLPHKLVGQLLGLPFYFLQKPPDKTIVFYGIRIVLGLVAAACEASFVDGVTRRLGARPGILTFLFLLTSAGVFQASTAMLPSSAAAYFVMLVHARWLRRRYARATLLAVLAVLALGWPFIALLFVPLALHVLIDQMFIDESAWKGLTRVIGWGLMSLALVLPSVLLIDFYYYRRLVFPALSILLYNVGGGPEGADDKLYGVEPWTFYLKNLLLNLNIMLPLALALPLALLVLATWPGWSARTRVEAAVFVSPAWLWLATMTLRPHKEERFLFPIYPLLALSAALTLHGIIATLTQVASSFVSSSKAIGRVISRCFALLARIKGPSVILLHILLSSSRVISMTRNFGAPLALFHSFYHQELSSPSALLSTSLSKVSQALSRYQSATSAGGEGREEGLKSKGVVHPPWQSKRLCIGNEWYRFPASFFLPQEGISLNFIRSGFHGQLPQPFCAENGTWAPPLQPFNEYNKEEMSRYIPLHSCHYLVELFPPPSLKGVEADRSVVEERLRQLGEKRPWAWNLLRSYPLLDKDLSPSPYRAFWIPMIGQQHLQYGRFALLKRRDEADLGDDVDHGPQCSDLGF